MKRGLKNVLAWFLTVVLLVLCVDSQVTAYSEHLSGQTDITEAKEIENNISQSACLEVSNAAGCFVQFSLLDQWEDGYIAEVIITNESSESIQNWCLDMTWAGSVVDIWNAAIDEKTETGYKVKNAGWNQDINVGEKVSFGFRGQGNFSNFPVRYLLLGNIDQVDQESYSVAYRINGQWDDGYTAEIAVSNRLSNSNVEDWIIEFDFYGEIYDIWNASIIKHENNHYVIQNKGYNANILPGQTILFGFNAEGDKSEPKNIVLYDVNQIDTVEECILQINKSDFERTEIPNEVKSTNREIVLRGTLSGTESVDEFWLEINEKDGFKRYTIPVATEWTTQVIELTEGRNTIEVLAREKSGAIIKDDIVLLWQHDDIPQTELDRNDDDEDGLPNYYEEYLGTRKDLPDSDGDELSDYEEVFFTLTNPMDPDSDDDGTGDAQDDEDGDGLSNYDEILLSTNPQNKDTDEDGLQDEDELRIHNTIPTNNDSDGDEIQDGLEITLGSDPNGYDAHIRVIAVSQDEDIVRVSVEAELTGGQADSLSVHKDDSYYIPEDAKEYVGGAYDFSVRGDISEATIRFEFPEELLNDPEFDPVICYFNQETQELEAIETTVINNVAIAKVKHFSTYLLFFSKFMFNGWYYEKQVWRDADQFWGQAETEVVLVIEDSLSMGNRDPLYKRLQYAKDLIDKMPDGCKMGIVRCADIAESFTEELTNDKELLKSFLTSEYFKSEGATGYSKGSRLAYSMLDTDDHDKEKHMVFFIDDGIMEKDVSQVNAIQLWEHNVKKSTVSFAYYNIWNNNGSYSDDDIRKETNYLLKVYGDYLSETKNPDSPNDLINWVYEQVYYRVDDKTDTDEDGLADFYERNIVAYGNKSIHLDENDKDTDDDGIFDGDEVTGCSYELNEDKTKVRILAHFVCNPCDQDTDHDGLWDEDELYVWGTAAKRQDTDYDGLRDGFEVELGYDPLEEDADHDGRLDKQEMAEGTSPYVYDMTWDEYLLAFLNGALKGDFIKDPQDFPTMAGQIVGSFLPLIDIRDVAANTYYGRPLMTGLSMMGLVPVFGDIAGSSGKCVKFIAKNAEHPSLIIELVEFLEKNFPDLAKQVSKSDEFDAAIMKLAKSDLTRMTDVERKGLAKLLKKAGYADNAIKILEKGSKPSARVLRDNMIKKLGKVTPNFPFATHHIVAGKDKRAASARAILLKYGIDINDAVNGVFLPTVKNVSPAAYHRSLHTKKYYDNVNEMLNKATSKQEVIDVLETIYTELLNGTFSY